MGTVRRAMGGTRSVLSAAVTESVQGRPAGRDVCAVPELVAEMAAHLTGGGEACAAPSATLVAAARAWLAAGDASGARALGEKALSLSAPGVETGRAALVLGHVHAVLGDSRAAATHLRTAVDAARGSDPAVAAEALVLLALPTVLRGELGSAPRALEEARQALEEAVLPADHPLRAAHAAAEVALGLCTAHRVDVAGPATSGPVVRLLGGLAVSVDGQPVELPAGAASTTVALLALRRAVHLEELTEVLWPDVEPPVARRRLRNVLTRVRHAAGPILVRHGDRIELSEEVEVDHHVLETRARRVLAAPEGASHLAELTELLAAHSGPLLPEAAYDEWARDARAQAEAREEALRRALEQARAG